MEDILKKLPDLETGIDTNLNINVSYRIKKKITQTLFSLSTWV